MIKFLVIRFSSIGDIVLTTPLFRCLKQQMEDVQIHFLTKERFRNVLAGNPYIYKIHCLKDSLQEIIPPLKEEKFDYVIDLHHNIRSARVKAKLGILSFAFDKLNVEKWLLVNLKINRLPKKHIVDRYMDTIKLFDISLDQNGLDFFYKEKDADCLGDLPKTHQLGYICFVIGAMHFTKKLPNAKIISLIQKLELPVVLIGGKEDAKDGESIVREVGEIAWNACGKYSLGESAALVKNARVVLTNDTGFMHIASAFHKKIISFWGNTVPEFGMYPYLPDEDSHIAEVKGLSCRPCSKIGYKSCPKRHFRCMQDINENQILTWTRHSYNI